MWPVRRGKCSKKSTLASLEHDQNAVKNSQLMSKGDLGSNGNQESRLGTTLDIQMTDKSHQRAMRINETRSHQATEECPVLCRLFSCLKHLYSGERAVIKAACALAMASSKVKKRIAPSLNVKMLSFHIG